MKSDLLNSLSRPAATLAQDFAGGAALIVILVVGLHLPGFV